MTILVTGAAGFIGMHTALRLLARGDEVVGIDNINDYYDVSLKEARLARLRGHKVAQKAGSVQNALGRIKDWFVGNF